MVGVRDDPCSGGPPSHGESDAASGLPAPGATFMGKALHDSSVGISKLFPRLPAGKPGRRWRTARGCFPVPALDPFRLVRHPYLTVTIIGFRGSDFGAGVGI